MEHFTPDGQRFISLGLNLLPLLSVNFIVSLMLVRVIDCISGARHVTGLHFISYPLFTAGKGQREKKAFEKESKGKDMIPAPINYAECFY